MEFQLHAATKEHVDTLHNVILLRIVGMIFGGNFQYSRNGSTVVLQDMSYIICNVLVDENDTNVIPGRQSLKGLLNLRQLRVLLDNQKVGSLCGSVANACQQETRDSVLVKRRGKWRESAGQTKGSE
jgi:hypothetical protein